MVKRKLVLANNPLFAGPAYGERDRQGSPYREIDVELIDRDPNQPRRTFDEDRLKELAHSIATYGILNPLFVRPSQVPGRYMLIAGERRLRAAQIVGLAKVPVLVEQEGEVSQERTLAMQLVENLQRADLNPLERAHAIGALKERYTLSVRDIGEKLGISKSMVQRSLEILELPPDLLNALKEGASESKILILAKIEDPEIRASYLRDLDTLTRGQLEKDLAKKKKELPSTLVAGAEDGRLAEEMQRALGMRVRITRSNTNPDQGRVWVEFYSDQDLQALFQKLVREE